jgi:hypothetical protein
VLESNEVKGRRASFLPSFLSSFLPHSLPSFLPPFLPSSLPSSFSPFLSSFSFLETGSDLCSPDWPWIHGLPAFAERSMWFTYRCVLPCPASKIFSKYMWNVLSKQQTEFSHQKLPLWKPTQKTNKRVRSRGNNCSLFPGAGRHFHEHGEIQQLQVLCVPAVWAPHGNVWLWWL